MKSGKCPKCGSLEIAPNIPVLDRGHATAHDTLSAVVYEKPSAFFMRHPKEFRIRASICGDCGYTELYTDNPHELLESYRHALADVQKQQQEKRKRGDAY